MLLGELAIIEIYSCDEGVGLVLASTEDRQSASMVDKTIIGSVEKYLKAVNENGITVRFAVIFGSQVTGSANEWSDIDLIVVSPLFDGTGALDDIGSLWRITGKVDNRIEPIPCGEKQWMEDESTPIIEVARQSGEIVTPPI